MQIGVPKETAEGERRVALVPDVVGKLAGSEGDSGTARALASRSRARSAAPSERPAGTSRMRSPLP